MQCNSNFYQKCKILSTSLVKNKRKSNFYGSFHHFGPKFITFLIMQWRFLVQSNFEFSIRSEIHRGQISCILLFCSHRCKSIRSFRLVSSKTPRQAQPSSSIDAGAGRAWLSCNFVWVYHHRTGVDQLDLAPLISSFEVHRSVILTFARIWLDYFGTRSGNIKNIKCLNCTKDLELYLEISLLGVLMTYPWSNLPMDLHNMFLFW